MGDKKQKVSLISIEAPDLSNSNYGENIAQQFKNINTNFENIIHSEFLKGKQGESISNVEVNLDSADYTGIYMNLGGPELVNAKGTDIKKLIIDYIEKKYDPSVLMSVKMNDKFVETPGDDMIGWDKYLKNAKIIMICSKDKDNYNSNLYPISSMMFILKDARYNESYKTYDPEVQEGNKYSNLYDTLVDVSCVLVWDKDKFVEYKGFPTLYYDKELKDFCWKLNGEESSIPATGPQGVKGQDGKTWVVTVKDSDSISNDVISGFKIYTIDKVLEIKDKSEANWVKVNDGEADSYFDFGETSSAIVFKDSILEDETKSANYWVSPIKYVNINQNKIPVVTINEGMAVMGLQSNLTFLHMLRSIGSNAISNPIGLFVPEQSIQNFDSNMISAGDKQAAHGLFSVSVDKSSNAITPGLEYPISSLIHDTNRNPKWNNLLLSYSNNILGDPGRLNMNNLEVKDLYVNYNTHFKGSQFTIDNDEQTLFGQSNKIGFKVPTSKNWEFNIGIYNNDYNYKEGQPKSNIIDVFGNQNDIKVDLVSTKQNVGNTTHICKDSINVTVTETGSAVDGTVTSVQGQPEPKVIEKSGITIISKKIEENIAEPLNFETFSKVKDYNEYLVGINNMEPTTELDVNGSAKISGSLSLNNLNIAKGLNIGSNQLPSEISLASGSENNIAGNNSAAFGQKNSVSGNNAMAFGQENKVSGSASCAFGFKNQTSGSNAQVEGSENISAGNSSHAEGHGTEANGDYSHSEGSGTNAVGSNSHAEGSGSISNGGNSHAEGSGTNAVGSNSHAEGSGTTSNGNNSHAEGSGTDSIGNSSHAEGKDTKTNGDYSHAEGYGTLTNNPHEHAEGIYNKSNPGTISSVGIGESDVYRKNALEILNNGDIYIKGLGDYDGTNTSKASDLKSIINGLTGITTDGNGSLKGHTHEVGENTNLRYNSIPVKLDCNSAVAAANEKKHHLAVWDIDSKQIALKKIDLKELKKWSGDLMPIGSIIMWTKTSSELIKRAGGEVDVQDIPVGWEICDGRSIGDTGLKTPNFVDKFVRASQYLSETDQIIGEDSFEIKAENLPDLEAEYSIVPTGQDLTPDAWDIDDPEKDRHPTATIDKDLGIMGYFRRMPSDHALDYNNESNDGKKNRFFKTTGFGVLKLEKLVKNLKLKLNKPTTVKTPLKYVPKYYSVIYIIKCSDRF